MKKVFLVILGLCSITAFASDQFEKKSDKSDNKGVFKNGYFKVSYVNEDLKPVEAGSILNVAQGENLKSDFGVALDWGGMKNFTKRPIIDMLNIGLDLHLALQYAKYKEGAVIGTTGSGTAAAPILNDLNHFSAGIGIGPAVAVAPFGKFDGNILSHLVAKAFYHFTPSYSGLFHKDKQDKTAFKGGFCLYQSIGCEVSYRRLGVGIEHMTGSCKYSDFDIEGLLSGGSSSNKEKSKKQKIESKAFRVFVSLKF